MINLKSLTCFCLLFAGLTLPIYGKVVSKSIMYYDGKTTLDGFVYYDDISTQKRPGILIAHQWMGITAYEKKRANELAQLGYVVLLADIYGRGNRPNSEKTAAEKSTAFKNDRTLMRKRAQLALNTLQKQPLVSPEHVGAIGYCFGGTVVLELARSGAPLKGVVSFHGGLTTPTPQDAKAIQGQVLVLHGADDPYVSWDEVSAFRKEMQDGQVKWQLSMYGNAVHAFSQIQAGNDPSKGAAYNRNADKRSFDEMKRFFEEVL